MTRSQVVVSFQFQSWDLFITNKINNICGRTWVQPIFSTLRCWIKVSGSGNEWKLHSKGFDEELEEGQVKLVSSPIQPDIGEKPILSFEIENFCPLISKFETRSRISNDLWGFNKWLKLLNSQTLELRFKTVYSSSKPFVTKVGFNGEILCK